MIFQIHSSTILIGYFSSIPLDISGNNPENRCRKLLLFDWGHTFIPSKLFAYLSNEEFLDKVTAYVCTSTYPYIDKPHNPMINSGAITVASLLLNNRDMPDAFDYVSTIIAEIFLDHPNTVPLFRKHRDSF